MGITPAPDPDSVPGPFIIFRAVMSGARTKKESQHLEEQTTTSTMLDKFQSLSARRTSPEFGIPAPGSQGVRVDHPDPDPCGLSRRLTD